MSDKLTAIRIKYPNGTYSEQILFNVFAENVQVNSTTNLSTVLNSLNTKTDQIATISTDLDVLEARVDQIIAPTSSTLTLDEEVRDIRVGKDATRTAVVNYTSAGEAVRIQLDEMKENLNNEFTDLKSAIEETGLIPIKFTPIPNEYVVDTDGSFVSYNTWSRTDYIPVTPKEVLLYSNSRASTYNVWYDANKNFVSSFTLNVTESGAKTVPDNVYYVAISNKTTSLSELSLKRTSPYFRRFFDPTTMIFGMSLGNNEDIFQLPAGNYYYTSGTVINAPTNRSFRLTIFVRSGDSSNKGAILFDSSAQVYFNSSHSGIWDNWSTPLLIGDYINATTSLSYITQIQDNTDLYDLTPGVYYSNASNLVNCPTNQSFRLWIFNRTSGNTYLAVLISTDGSVYTNGKKSDGWIGWKAYEPSNDSTPLHYLDHMKLRCNDINSLADSLPVQSDSFIFITDYHVERNAKNSPNLIKRIIRDTGVRKLFFGGDAYQTNTSDKNTAMIQSTNVYSVFNEITPEFYPVVGNHEWNHYQSSSGECLHLDYELSQNGVYSCFLKRVEPLVKEVTNEGNYYIDNSNAKIRYIFLQCDGDARPTPETISWFGNLLSLTPSGYYVFVVTHYINMSGHASPNINTYTGRTTYFNQMVGDILTAYNNGTSYSKNVTYTANNVTKTYNVSFDYSSAPKNNVICILGGHWHEDDAKLKTSNNVLSVLTTCDQYRSGSGVITYEDNGETLERTLGTVREQAFDVVHIDTVHRKLYMTRIGAGSDRVFDW